MRILGLDVGDRTIGVALSDPLGLTAQRLTLLTRKNESADTEAVAALAAKHAVGIVVVGLPLMMSGRSGTQAAKTRAFAAALNRKLGLPIELVDERLTTVEGTRALLETNTSRRRRKEIIDQVAAQLILQQYLDRARPSTEPVA